MDIDLDKRKIGFFYLGQEMDIPYRYISGEGYIIYINDATVKGIRLIFSPGIEREETRLMFQSETYVYVSETPKLIFKDKIIKNGKVVGISKDTSPEDIARLFNVECNYRDDDATLDMTFSDGSCEFEFNWTKSGVNQIQLDSMLLEIQ